MFHPLSHVLVNALVIYTYGSFNHVDRIVKFPKMLDGIPVVHATHVKRMKPLIYKCCKLNVSGTGLVGGAVESDSLSLFIGLSFSQTTQLSCIIWSFCTSINVKWNSLMP